jgi:hypothetical protein
MCSTAVPVETATPLAFFFGKHNFFGLNTALLDHFDDFHGWPCFATVRTGKMYNFYLKDGLNTVLDKEQGGTVRRRQPLGCTISVLLVHPHAADH